VLVIFSLSKVNLLGLFLVYLLMPVNIAVSLISFLTHGNITKSDQHIIDCNPACVKCPLVS
jgi:hypothetical protein